MTNKQRKPVFRNWQWPLTLMFLCFGFLLAAQYQTNTVLSGDLSSESQSNLAMILKSVNDNKEQLQEELDSLESELQELETLNMSGESLSTALRSRIETLQSAIGDAPVEGPGISVTITGDSNLMFYDVIDIINEMFVTGAEAVAINNTRVTIHTAISEIDNRADGYSITIDGDPLLFPVVIKAIGDAEALSAGLTYPGGIIESLNTLYRVYPIIRLESSLSIPAAAPSRFSYAQAVEEEEEKAEE
ncbi:MAG: DUF881 domain-containing protein [Firmicutes bacterium]|nr:DUF881 domain-containing protein [Bacillota bacterium]